MGITRHTINSESSSSSSSGSSLTLRNTGLITALILSIYAATGQTGDLLGFFDSSDNKIAGVEADGTYYGPDFKSRFGESGEFTLNKHVDNSLGSNLAFDETQANVGQYYFDATTNAIKIKTPDKFFLIIGQSNAHGQGTIDPLIDVGGPNIYELNSDSRFELGLDPLSNQTHMDNDKMGFGVAFAREYIANNPNETIALVLNAKSGTSFGGGAWVKGGEQYEDAVKAANKLISMGSVFGGILWHQGESDSTTTSSSSYASNLSQMVTDLRTDIRGDNSQVPFIAGTLADDFITGNDVGSPTANREEVNNAILNIPTQIDYADYVDLSGLATIDNIHFNAASLRTAGARYYSTLIDTDATTEKTSGGVYISSKGYVIDGIDEYFSGATASTYGASGASNFSVVVTVKMDMTRTKTAYLFSLYDGSNRFEGSWTNSRFNFDMGTSTNRVYASPTRANKVYHVAFVFDGSGVANIDKAKIYVDGVEETAGTSGTIPATIPSIGASGVLNVGARYVPPSGVGSYFDETVIEVSLFNKTLSASEVSTLYNSGSFSDPRLITGLVSTYWFGDNASDSETMVLDNQAMNNLTGYNLEAGDIVTY